MNWGKSSVTNFSRYQDPEGIFYDCHESGSKLLIGRNSNLQTGKHELSEYTAILDESTKIVVGIVDGTHVSYIGKVLQYGNETGSRIFHFETDLSQGFSTDNKWASLDMVKALSENPFLEGKIMTGFEDLKKSLPDTVKSIENCTMQLSIPTPEYDK